MNPVFCYKAYVYNVVDGDTFDARVDVGFKIEMNLRFRMSKINAPEKRGASRAEGLRSTVWLEEQILEKDVVVETFKSGSFGRWLAIVYIDGVEVNQLMVDKGFAVPYKKR